MRVVQDNVIFWDDGSRDCKCKLLFLIKGAGNPQKDVSVFLREDGFRNEL